MRGDQKRYVVLARDLEFIYKQVVAAKGHLQCETPAWNALNLAETRFQTLALFGQEYHPTSDRLPESAQGRS